MNTVWEILYARQMAIHYAAPPICEVIFSGSSNPVIILSEPALNKVTGLVFGGVGNFTLSWNDYPGAICYNVYLIGGSNVAVPLAQCVDDTMFILPDNLDPGDDIVVTAITPEGETPPSDPVPYPGGGPAQSVSLVASCPVTSDDVFPGVFEISRGAATAGNLVVHFTLGGTAVNGVDYELIPTSVTIPNGLSSALVEILPINPPTELKTVILTLVESPTYFVEPPGSATVSLRLAYLRIQGYGDTTPLFSTAPAPVTGEQPALPSSGCEWAGIFTYLQHDDPVPGPEFIYYYQDSAGNITDGMVESIQGTKMTHAILSGPFSGGAVKWQMQIVGELEDSSLYVIWQGYIPTGSSEGPDGTYQIAGPPEFYTDGRATVVIETA